MWPFNGKATDEKTKGPDIWDVNSKLHQELDSYALKLRAIRERLNGKGSKRIEEEEEPDAKHETKPELAVG